MSQSQRERASLVLAAILFGLAMLAPAQQLLRASRSAPGQDAGSYYVQAISQSSALRDAIADEVSIGYVSDDEVDIRSGGAAQARYYLSQFAVAPVLLDLEHERYDLLLLNFSRAQAVDPYLNRHRLRRLVDVTDTIVLAGPRARR